jgi:hypothetical protein
MASDPTFSIHLPQLDAIQAMLEAVLLERRPRQAWYTLEQSWRRKHAAVIEEGSISLQTFKNARAFQPKGGKEDGWISNRKVWKEDSIEEWLLIDDDGLADYLAKYGATCKIPDRITSAVKARG